MRRLGAPALLLAISITLLASCSQLITAYLVNELLNDKAPKFTWRGTVTDSESRGIPDLTVRVRAEVAGDPNPVDVTGLTNTNGQYQIVFKWNAKVSYRVSVIRDGVVLAERFVGAVGKGDQRDDFTVEGSANIGLSGVVRDAAGDPIPGVLVIASSVGSLGGTPSPFRTVDDDVQHVITPSSGVFTFTGSTQRYAIVTAFHPDRGFAYNYGEDTDGNGEIGLNLNMGTSGQHQLNVQVVDGTGMPVSNQVLDAARQFRLRLSTPFNLSSTINEVVTEQALYPAFTGLPSELHPTGETLLVQSTGVGGVADSSLTIRGGTYQLDLLAVGSEVPATALILGTNPLPVAGPTTVVVRVN